MGEFKFCDSHICKKNLRTRLFGRGAYAIENILSNYTTSDGEFVAGRSVTY